MPNSASLTSYLTRGVSYHAFSDHSGCVFYNHITGETVSTELNELDIYHNLTLTAENVPEETQQLIKQLINTGLITKLPKQA